MAGRGGFKGASSSLRPEQLQGMGIMGKDMPNATIAPPPIYPPLQSRPAALERTPERDSMIEWKENFSTYLKNSVYYTGGSDESKHLQSRYFLDSSQKENGAFNWAMMPSELKPTWKRKLQSNGGVKKLARDVNIEEAFQALEKKEGTRTTTKEDDDHSDNEIEDDKEDEEMDEDNDYGISHFDDGGNYLDEDDNLDDGPTY